LSAEIKKKDGSAMDVELWLREREGPVQSEGELGSVSVFQ